MAEIQVLWRNYAVGQGGMALLSFVHDGNRINVVYDCGVSSGHGSALPARLQQLSDDLGPNGIDLLFISHLHHDHLSGLSALATLLGDRRVRRVMMPAWDVATVAVAANDVLGRSPHLGESVRNGLAIVGNPGAHIGDLFDGVRVVEVRRPVPGEPDVGPPPPEFGELRGDHDEREGTDIAVKVTSATPVSARAASARIDVMGCHIAELLP